MGKQKKARLARKRRRKQENAVKEHRRIQTVAMLLDARWMPYMGMFRKVQRMDKNGTVYRYYNSNGEEVIDVGQAAE